MQALTGRPSARTRHWAHWPLAQKMPWGAPSLVMVAEDPHAVGEQGRGDGLALSGRQGPALPGEGDGFARAAGVRIGMAFDAISAHESLLDRCDAADRTRQERAIISYFSFPRPVIFFFFRNETPRPSSVEAISLSGSSTATNTGWSTSASTSSPCANTG